MEIIAVIPARFDSSRFAGKVLARETGKYLVEHTWERAMAARRVGRVLVATDDERVVEACGQFGAECVMTRREHQSGTDRIAEAVADIQADIVVNVQADEPEIDPEHIDRVVELLVENPDDGMATLVTEFDSPEQVANPNIVKAVVDHQGRALYFSRSAIPYCRESGGVGRANQYLWHLGIYGYRKEFLMKFCRLEAGRLEKMEKLEQLRALEYGHSIRVGKVAHFSEGIDTAGQYARFVERYQMRSREQ